MDLLSTVDKHIAMLTLDPETIIAVNNHGGRGGTKAEAALPHVLTMYLSALCVKSTIFYVNPTKTIPLDTLLFLRVCKVRS